MTKEENGKKYALIAAICYAAWALYNIYVESDFIGLTKLLIPNIAMLGMAVALFWKKTKMFAVAVGAYTLYIIYANCIINSWFSKISLLGLCDFLAYVLVMVLAILTLKRNAAVKKIWCIPSLLMFLGYISTYIQDGYGGYLFDVGKINFLFLMSVKNARYLLIVVIVESIVLLFVGMWLKGIVTPAEEKPVNEYATFNPQSINSTPASSSAIGGADKLKMYKDLLESGTITQEEFDAKKKQILGL